jgi:hypothetical protein
MATIVCEMSTLTYFAALSAAAEGHGQECGAEPSALRSMRGRYDH